MLKELLAGIFLSLVLVGQAVAHEPADVPGQAGVRVEQGDPGPAAVPGGPPPVETPASQTVEEYQFGVNGFLRGEGSGNFNRFDFTTEEGHKEGHLVYRVKPYAFWHPTDYLDIHLDGQAYGFLGGGPNDSQISLYQGYVEAKLPETKLLALKAGRQEFSYGSNFMLGPDAFYNGLSFDSARLRVNPTDYLSVDLFGGFYAPKWADGLKGDLSGAYATWTISDRYALEGYFMRDTGSSDHHAGEVLDSYGLRGTAKMGPVSLEVEPVYQSGYVFNSSTGGNDRISAFGGHADLTAELDLGGLHHKWWGGYAFGSGSRAAAEGVTSKHEFRNPNNDTAIVGDIHAFGDLSGISVQDHHASGVHVYTLGWGIDLAKKLNLSATGHYFHAAVEPGFSKNLGLETDFTATYAFSDDCALVGGYDHYFTGAFFREAGSGEDIHYGYLMLQFNLDRAKLKPAKKGA